MDCAPQAVLCFSIRLWQGRYQEVQPTIAVADQFNAVMASRIGRLNRPSDFR